MSQGEHLDFGALVFCQFPIGQSALMVESWAPDL